MNKRTLEEKQRVNEFLEEFIALQLKHNLMVEGYDINIWTQEDSNRALEENPNTTIGNITEGGVREYWERSKEQLSPRSRDLT